MGVLKGFKDFILRGNVVDLAVAVVVGAAFSAVVSSFVADLLTPLIAAIAGKPDFSGLAFTLHNSVFHYGRFINALISFLFVAAAVYFAVVVPMQAIARRREQAKAAPARPDEVVLLEEIRDLLAARDSAARDSAILERSERPALDEPGVRRRAG